ncbi:MAG TPA: trypsin-like peptidase domain-containing protein [Steroidobacteraceae bacterium]|nr:trypsin-like peptidase domain-containing protein [Steroidobacteraceae bacterium]
MKQFLVGLVLVGLLSTWQALAASQPESLSQVFKRVGPAVVVIHTSGRAVGRETGGKVVNVAGSGSGVLVSGDGKIVTAAHVVHAADAVAVEFPGGVIVRARVIASDPAADVALLQLESVPPGAVTAKFGNSDKAEVGDQIFVVGAPLGMSHTLTVGHLSARREVNATYGGMGRTELFQTDAAINPGNSGGPMFNMNGEIIGVVSRIISRSGGSEGIGLVVTSNMAQRLLFEEPTVWSGLEGYLLTPELASALNVPGGGPALLVQRVAEGSPAARMGLRGGTLPVTIGQENFVLGGDIVLAVEGIGIGTPSAYELIRKRLIEIQARGGTVGVTVLRDGRTVGITARTGRGA